jgi:hypothetical protein
VAVEPDLRTGDDQKMEVSMALSGGWLSTG